MLHKPNEKLGKLKASRDELHSSAPTVRRLNAPERSRAPKSLGYGSLVERRRSERELLSRADDSGFAARGREKREAERAARIRARKKRNKVFAIAALIAVVFIVYASGVAHYSKVFAPRTNLGELDISGMTPAAVQEILETTLPDYVLRVTGKNFVMNIDAGDIGLSYTTETTGKRLIRARHPWLWPIELCFSKDVSRAAKSTYSIEKLESYVQAVIDEHNAEAAATQGEHIAYNREAGAFEYVEYVLGEQLVYDEVLPLVQKALDQMLPELELPESTIVKPEPATHKAELTEAAQEATALCNSYDVTFKMGENGSFVLDRNLIFRWVVVGDDYSVSLDQAKMDQFVEDFANAFNQKDGTRTYWTAYNKKVTVEGGDYYWAADREEVKTLVRKGFEQKTGEIVIPVTHEGKGFWGYYGADWGPRYIDVDITTQYARFYGDDGSIIWEADITSGQRWTDFATPTGVWTVNDKGTNVALRSYGDYVYVDENGETQVEHNHQYGRDVYYWMPFINNFIGLHDAWWKTEFGGNLYEYAAYGSGGCINMSTENAKALYDLIEVGDVVVTHY